MAELTTEQKTELKNKIIEGVNALASPGLTGSVKVTIDNLQVDAIVLSGQAPIIEITPVNPENPGGSDNGGGNAADPVDDADVFPASDVFIAGQSQAMMALAGSLVGNATVNQLYTFKTHFQVYSPDTPAVPLHNQSLQERTSNHSEFLVTLTNKLGYGIDFYGYAEGNARLSQFLVGGSSHANFKAALDVTPNTCKNFVWYQGTREGAEGVSGASYKENLVQLIEWVYTNYPHIQYFHIVPLGRVTTQVPQKAWNIRNAHAESVVLLNSNVFPGQSVSRKAYITPMPLCRQYDQYHQSKEGNIELGNIFGEYFKTGRTGPIITSSRFFSTIEQETVTVVTVDGEGNEQTSQQQQDVTVYKVEIEFETYNNAYITNQASPNVPVPIIFYQQNTTSIVPIKSVELAQDGKFIYTLDINVAPSTGVAYETYKGYQTESLYDRPEAGGFEIAANNNNITDTPTSPDIALPLTMAAGRINIPTS